MRQYFGIKRFKNLIKNIVINSYQTYLNVLLKGACEDPIVLILWC